MVDNNIIYSLLREILFDDKSSPLEEIDWTEIYRTLTVHGVACLAGKWLGEHPISDEAVQNKWVNFIIQRTLRLYQLYDAQSQLLGLLKNNHIQHAVMKGGSTAILYPHPEFRMMNDIDILVLRKQYDNAKQLLLENGYTLSKNDEGVGYDTVFQKNGVVIELHNRICGVEPGTHFDYLCELTDQGVEKAEYATFESFAFPVLPRLQRGLVLLLHIKHHFLLGIRLSHIVDWMMFVDQCLDDDVWKNEFQPVLQKIELEQFAKVVTKACHQKLGLRKDITWCVDVEDSLCNELLNYVMDMVKNGREAMNPGRGMELLSEIRNLKDLFVVLQRNGCLTWTACQKYPFLKPFAWIYQGFKYIGIALTRKNASKQMKSDIQASKKRKEFFKRLGI